MAMLRSICPHCSNEEARVRYDYGHDKIVRCSRCTLLYLHPWPDEEQTAAVYADTYFENKKFFEGDSSALFGYADYVAECSPSDQFGPSEPVA